MVHLLHPIFKFNPAGKTDADGQPRLLTIHAHPIDRALETTRRTWRLRLRNLAR